MLRDKSSNNITKFQIIHYLSTSMVLKNLYQYNILGNNIIVVALLVITILLYLLSFIIYEKINISGIILFGLLCNIVGLVFSYISVKKGNKFLFTKILVILSILALLYPLYIFGSYTIVDSFSIRECHLFIFCKVTQTHYFDNIW
jgi:hypothetical protein